MKTSVSDSYWLFDFMMFFFLIFFLNAEQGIFCTIKTVTLVCLFVCLCECFAKKKKSKRGSFQLFCFFKHVMCGTLCSDCVVLLFVKFSIRKG